MIQKFVCLTKQRDWEKHFSYLQQISHILKLHVLLDAGNLLLILHDIPNTQLL